MDNLCNCDAMPPVQRWMKDTGVFTNSTLLPITGFKYGYLRGAANVTVGNLICKGAVNVDSVKSSCNAIKYVIVILYYASP